MSRRKKITTAVALLAIAILLLSGTFAWIDQFQHKTNEAEGTGTNKYNAVLIENTEEIKNWKVSDAPKKQEAKVKNVGTDSDSFGDIYTRLQLKEYLETTEFDDYTYSAERLAVDTSGNFIKVKDDASNPGNPDPTDLAAVMAAHPEYNDGRALVPYTNHKDGKDYHYIPTKEKDINGQFGKQLITGVTKGATTPLIAGAVRHSDDASLLHNADRNGECTYETVTWNQTDDNSAKFREYVKLKLGDKADDTIFFSDWVTDGCKPVAKWILDDTPAPDGTFWAYWGGSIAPGDETANLLKTVDLIKQPAGKMYYAMHVDMEASSIDEIDTWTDAPTEILDMYKNLANAKVQVAPDPDPTVRTVMQGATQGFKATLTDPTLLGSVTWKVEGSRSPTNKTTIDTNGVLTVATDEPKDTVLTVKAISTLIPVKVGAVKVKVVESKIKITPTPDATVTVVYTGIPQAFKAEIPGDPTATFTNWQVTGSMGKAAGTTISSAGLLSIDTNEQNGNQLTITAEKVGDSTKTCIPYTVRVSVPITSVTVTPNSATLTSIGETKNLTAVVSPASATQTVTWTSSDETIATVDSSTGEVTAVKEGTVTITATSTEDTSKKGTATVKVDLAVTGVTVTPANSTLTVYGEIVSLSATVNPTEVTQQTVTWTSSDETIATVNSSGIVTAMKDGTVTITATSTKDPSKSGTATVTVDIPVIGVNVTPANSTITDIGGTKTLTATVTPTGVEQTVTWASSDTSIATVDATTGVVTAIKDGEVTITATSTKDKGKSGTATVTVSESKIQIVPSPTATVTDVYQGRTQVFAASIPGDPTATFTNWQMIGSDALAGETKILPTTDTTATLTVDASETIGNELTITAEKVGDSTKSCVSYTVTVQELNIVLNKTTVTMEHGTTSPTFTASLPGFPSATFTWTTSGGTLSGSGASRTLTVPTSVVDGTTITVTVTSTSPAGYSATITVNVVCTAFDDAPHVSTLNASTPAGTLFEADGMTWILLKNNGGQALIISKDLIGTSNFKAVTPYNPGYNDDTCLLRTAMRNFYDGLPAGGDLMSRAQAVLTPNGSTSTSETTNGLTTVSGSGTEYAFALSTADFNTSNWGSYCIDLKRGYLSGAASEWWLRSPYTNTNYAQYVYIGGYVSYYSVTLPYGVRPALMINLNP